MKDQTLRQTALTNHLANSADRLLDRAGEDLIALEQQLGIEIVTTPDDRTEHVEVDVTRGFFSCDFDVES